MYMYMHTHSDTCSSTYTVYNVLYCVHVKLARTVFLHCSTACVYIVMYKHLYIHYCLSTFLSREGGVGVWGEGVWGVGGEGGMRINQYLYHQMKYFYY